MGNHLQESFIFVEEEIEFLGFEDLLAFIVSVRKKNKRSEVRTIRYFLYYRQCLQEFRDSDLTPAFIGKQFEKSLLGLL